MCYCISTVLGLHIARRGKLSAKRALLLVQSPSHCLLHIFVLMFLPSKYRTQIVARKFPENPEAKQVRIVNATDFDINFETGFYIWLFLSSADLPRHPWPPAVPLTVTSSRGQCRTYAHAHFEDDTGLPLLFSMLFLLAWTAGMALCFACSYFVIK